MSHADSPLPPQKILLTGGRSRLAKVIVPPLGHDGANVVSFSRTADESHRSLSELFTGDHLATANTVLHLAWSTLPLSSELQPGSEEREDLPLLVKILDSIRLLPASARPHFIFFSSGGAVYGNARDNQPSRETDVCAPIGNYGRAKRAAEQIIEDFAGRHNLSYTILRISNPYGFAASIAKPQGLLPFIVKYAREGTPFSVWGDGTARKDFMYHSDFTAAVREILRRQPVGIFNVSSGRSHSVNEVIALAEKALSLKLQTRHLQAHAWDVHDSLLDNTKLRAAIQWQPKITLAEGIRRAVEDL
jgi:UDP-glucose 4-epimerase